MAAPNKKAKLAESQNSDDSLLKFKEWLNSENVFLNEKVSILKGSCRADYGMIANEDIECDQVLFSIPRSSVLSPENCAISEIISKDQDILKSDSSWVPLLVALIYEYLNKNSRWRPYLDLFFRQSDLNHPMFWSEDELKKELTGTGLLDLIQSDVTNMKKEFAENALPFMKKHPQFFGQEAMDFELYKKLVGFIMAYSFSEPHKLKRDEEEELKMSPPIMVPVADVLNHVAKNNAKLHFGDDCLKMMSVKQIHKGEEVFNTYGELSSSQLLHMYGFSEPYPENIYDAIEFPVSNLLTAFKENLSESDLLFAHKKWAFLKELGIISENDMFAFAEEGVLTCEQMFNTLKVMFMNQSQFDLFKENEEWSESEEDQYDDLNIESFCRLPVNWKQIFTRLMETRLAQFDRTFEEEQSALQNVNNLNLHEKYALYVRYSQQKLLNNFIKSCKNNT